MSESTPAPAPKPGVTLPALIWIGVAVIVLSFVASFLGATLARSTDAAPEPTVVETPSPTPTEEPDFDPDEYAQILEEILPAGSAVRAGNGAPEEGKGYEGDVYIDVQTSDVWVFRNGAWVRAGNLREEMAENLAGEQGPPGEQGAPGEPGAPGTQVTLGVGAPSPETCEHDGDVFIDTATVQFYECTAGEWVLFDSSTADPVPAE